MPIEKYSIGGTMVETEAFEAFADIPQNRVLLAEKLTINPPVRPEIVEGLTNVEEVFAHFKPNVKIDFETEAGGAQRETLTFTNLGDFGIKGITAQSSLLRELNAKKQEYQKIIRKLKSNKLLKQVLSQPQSKAALLNALQALIMEIDEAEAA